MITLTNSGWNSGLKEWVLQRLTALYISSYTLFIVFYLYFLMAWSIIIGLICLILFILK